MADDHSRYQHPIYGVIGLDKDSKNNGPSCDNFHLFTAEYLNNLHQSIDNGLHQSIDPFCIIGKYEIFILQCEVEPGLYHRFPGRKDQTISHDEIFGIAWMSWYMDLNFSRQILTYGRRNKWCWNNVNPGVWTKTSFLARMVDLIPFLKKTAKIELSLIDIMLYSASLIWNSFDKYDETSGKCMKYLQISVMKKESKIIDLAIMFWLGRMSSMYPLGPREMLGIYFGADHCITQSANCSWDIV